MKTSFCFICGITKEEFDARALDDTGLDFVGHVTVEHNMWDYMFFRIYLSLRDPNEYNGVETYIAALTREDDIGWIPKGKTMGINDGTQDEEATESERRIQKDFSELSESLQSSLRHNFEATVQSRQSDSGEMREMFNSIKGEVELLKAKVEKLSENSAK